MKHIWKKLSAGLLAFALVFTTIPPVTVSADTADTGAATSQREEVIDVSTSNSFTIPNTGDVTYVLTGTNTAAEVYIGGDCDIILRDVTLKRIYTNYADALTVNITLDGDNLIHQDKSASQGALEVRRSQVTINGDADDSLHAKSRAFPAYSNSDEVEVGGGLTINGGNITFELTEQSGGAPIQTAYTQNGGTVKVIGTTSYCFQYKVYMNGGSLEAEHHSAYEGRLAFNHYVYMKNGASIKVSSSERPIGGAGRFKLGEGSSANDCIFVRFDDSSDFVYLDADDEENPVLNDKNYAEIKVMEHDHDFDGSGCSCGFVCKHDTDNGSCGVCGTYIYNISHQPTEAEPYVTLNDGTGASYQWYQMKNISEITDKSKTYPLSTFDPEYFTESSTFDAAIGWIPADYSEEGYEYKNLLYAAAPYKEGDKVTIYFSSPVDYARLFDSGGNSVECEFDGNKATAVIPADGVYAVHASTEDTEPTARVYVGDEERSALAGQTGATLSQYTYGDYYFCEATAKDGTVLTSALADFTYKITHQPTDREQYVSLNSSKGASYQWYVERGGIVQVTGEDDLGFTVLGAPPEEIGGTYDSETGWTPDEYGYYFVVWLDEGNAMNLEFSQTPEECFYLFSATEGTVEDEVYFGESLTAPASGYYGICAVGGGNLKATMDGTEFIAVSGQTDVTLNASELGRYRCEVTFGNGTKKTSDVVEVQHLHAGGTATCKAQAVCSTCGLAYGPISKEHTYGSDKKCTVCGAPGCSKLGHSWNSGKVTKEATCTAIGTKKYTCTVCSQTKTETIAKKAHSYKSATCTKAKTCKACGKTSGDPMGHSYSTSYTVDKKATTSAAGSKSKHCSRCDAKKSVTSIPKIASQKLSYTKTAYNGKTKKPSVTIKDAKGNVLENGTDYTVSYASGRTKVGRYKVTITYKGEYRGSKVLYFTIVPKKPSSASASISSASQTGGYDDIKFSWKASTGAKGYLVYYKKASASQWSGPVATTKTSYTKKNLSDGVKYTFKVIPYYKTSSDTTKYYSTEQYKTASAYTLKKVTNVKVVKSGTKVKVSWKNINGETGYQISKSTSKSKTNIVKTYKTTSGKYKKISATKGKTYYYKVRAYKVVNDKKIYGPWSEVKSYKRK